LNEIGNCQPALPGTRSSGRLQGGNCRVLHGESGFQVGGGRSAAFRNPNHNGEAYRSRATMVALITSYRSVVGIPLPRSTFRAYIDEEHEPRILTTCLVTESLSSIITLRIDIAVTRFPIVTEASVAREGLFERTTAISRVFDRLIWRFLLFAQTVMCSSLACTSVRCRGVFSQ